MVRYLLLAGALAVVGCADVVEIEGVVYDARYGNSTAMDVYLPDNAETGRPGVLWIHGGGWSKFHRDVHTDHSIRLARAGYVAATIDYRLVPEGVYTDLVKDCFCALAHFRANADEYGLDPNRVAIAGYSAGGHLVSMLGTTYDLPDVAPDCGVGPAAPPNAVISGAGIHDMREMPEADAVVEFVGGTKAQVPGNYDVMSPILHINANTPPFLFVHGKADLFVDIEQSEWMQDALQDAGIDARLLAINGGGHITNVASDIGHADIFVSSIDTPESWTVISDFLERTIGAP
jgi:acetyl esterase/lipase